MYSNHLKLVELRFPTEMKHIFYFTVPYYWKKHASYYVGMVHVIEKIVKEIIIYE